MRKNCQAFLEDRSALNVTGALYRCTRACEKEALRELNECDKYLSNLLEITSIEVERLQSAELSRLNGRHLEQISAKLETQQYYITDSEQLLKAFQRQTESCSLRDRTVQLAKKLKETGVKHKRLVVDFKQVLEARVFGPQRKHGKSGRPNGIQLKIYLTHSEPQIWRRLHVAAEATLGDLHVLINKSMGWSGFETHGFRIRDLVYSNREYDYDEDEVTLEDLNLRKQTKIEYVYDRHEMWHFTVEFEKKLESPHDSLDIVEGIGASPPAGCDGLNEYYEILNVLKNPKHEDYSHYRKIYGKRDPSKVHTLVI